MNDKVYIHELIDIIGPNRSKYVHHMTANWSPIAQEERNQRCFGVWGVVGSTGRWPMVVNLWEEDGWDGLARSFAHELERPTMQDEKLERWWAEAASYRSGGLDRILVPAGWTSTIDELCAAGVRGVAYAHETIRLARPHDARALLDDVHDLAIAAYAEHGLVPVGAWRTAMHDDAECILLWGIPSWEAWGAFEQAVHHHDALSGWRSLIRDRSTAAERILLVDAPLSPLRIGRQPARSDRDPTWSE